MQVIEQEQQQPAPKRRLGSHEGWILAVCCVAQFMVILDLSIVNVALPSIQSSLGFSSPELQWVIDAYSIVFAGFLMLGGRAADSFGQRRIFVASLALFAIASLIGGAAQDKDMLIGARGLQGLAGAFMAAASLAIITASFEPGPKLHRAIGTWAAMNGLGGAAGVLLGGIITEALSWRWVLLINPPIGIATALVAYAVVRSRKRPVGESFDLAGAITLTVGQMVLVYGVVEAGLRGWSSMVAIVPIVIGLILLGAFGVIESRFASNPLVPVKKLTRALKVANTIVLFFSASLFAMWFVASLYLQQVLGLSPLHTGLTFLPMTIVIMLSASRAGALVSRFGVRPVLGTGLIMLGAGLVLLARIGPSGSGAVYIMIPGLLVAAGIGMSIVPSTIAATQGAKPADAGLASGIVNTARQVGAGLGLAIIVTLATQRTTHLIGTGQGVPESLTSGFRMAFLIGAACVAVAVIVNFLLMDKPTPSPAPAFAPTPSPGSASTAAAASVPGMTPSAAPAAAAAVASVEGTTSSSSPRSTPDASTSSGASPTTSRDAAASTGKPTGSAPAPRRRALAWTVAAGIAAFIALDFAFAHSHGAPVGAYVTDDTYAYISAPSLHPPKLEIEGKTDRAKLAPGYIFAANFFDINEPPMRGQSGPMILDDKLQPVWFKPVPEKVVASNLSLQRYEGNPALAWWQGVVTNTGATESGEDIVVNQHYQKIGEIKGKDGWKLTLHEILVRGHNVWVTANKDIPLDLSKYGGAYNGALIDSAVQEYDLKTGKLIYNWDALKHIPLEESEATLPTNGFPWDAYHINAISLLGDGTFLVSMRDTWAAYLVDIKSGKILWTLGGKKSSFKLGPGADFRWQHDVKIHPGGIVTMFDDHCCQLTGGGTYVKAPAPSRALILRLNERDHTAKLVAEYGRGYGLESDYMGNTQLLENGNVMVGWGSEPYLSELTKSEKPVLEGKLPGPDLSYRATVGQWLGLPLYPPAAAARVQGGKTTVYASWNGATEVASWRVLSAPQAGAGSEAQAVGESQTGSGAEADAGGQAEAEAGTEAGAEAGTGAGKVIASAPKSGFETAIPVPSGYKSFEVQALNSSGHVIGTSKRFG